MKQFFSLITRSVGYLLSAKFLGMVIAAVLAVVFCGVSLQVVLAIHGLYGVDVNIIVSVLAVFSFIVGIAYVVDRFNGK